MSADSADPASVPTPSDESWTELYDRTCGDTAPAVGERGREKRPRSPEFVPEKRLKQDALRLAFVSNKEAIKAHYTHFMASVGGSPTIEGLEAALTAWAAKLCGRPLGQELSSADELRFATEVEAAKGRELDAWGKFQVFHPVPQATVKKDVVETRWVLSWEDLRLTQLEVSTKPSAKSGSWKPRATRRALSVRFPSRSFQKRTQRVSTTSFSTVA